MYEVVTIGGVGGLILWAVKYFFSKDREHISAEFDKLNQKLDKAFDNHISCRESLPRVYLSREDAKDRFDSIEKKIDELKEDARRVDIDRRQRWAELAKILHKCTGKPIFLGATDTQDPYTVD